MQTSGGEASRSEAPLLKGCMVVRVWLRQDCRLTHPLRSLLACCTPVLPERGDAEGLNFMRTFVLAWPCAPKEDVFVLIVPDDPVPIALTPAFRTRHFPPPLPISLHHKPAPSLPTRFNAPHSPTVTGTNGRSDASVLVLSMPLTTLIPSITRPKTTCFPSRCGVGTVVKKNWQPFVLGPELAMLC
jgi:hypothetical protein